MLILLTFYLLENDRRSVETSFLIRDFCGVKNTIPFPKFIGDHFGVVVKKKMGLISGSIWASFRRLYRSFAVHFGDHFEIQDFQCLGGWRLKIEVLEKCLLGEILAGCRVEALEALQMFVSML